MASAALAQPPPAPVIPPPLAAPTDPRWDLDDPVFIVGRAARVEQVGDTLHVLVTDVETREGFSRWQVEGPAAQLPSPQQLLGQDIVVKAWRSDDKRCDPACLAYAHDITYMAQIIRNLG